jgi:polyhydroxyalkanoate synthase
VSTTETQTTESTYSPTEFRRRIQKDFERNLLRVRNGIKLAAGIDRPELGATPKDIPWTYDKMQLWRYRSDQRRLGPPVLMVMSLVSRSYIFDLRPGNSLVEYMLNRGFDVYVLDWGVPDHLDADNTLSTYCDDYLPRVVDQVRKISGSDDVTMFGYCFGGVLALLYAAGHQGPHLRNLLVAATPVDNSVMGPMSTITAEGRIDPESLIGEDGNVPAEVIENSFKMLKPTAEVAGYVNLWDNMWNDQYLESYQAMNGWARDQIPFPGACFVENVKVLGRENRMTTGVIPVGGREVRLADITCPFLSVIGEKDHIVPMEGGKGLADLVGSEDRQELVVNAGHVGLFVGRTAHKASIPPMADWLEAHSDEL